MILQCVERQSQRDRNVATTTKASKPTPKLQLNKQHAKSKLLTEQKLPRLRMLQN